MERGGPKKNFGGALHGGVQPSPLSRHSQRRKRQSTGKSGDLVARNYAALLHEYLEEMDILSDAEFGRLCRALLQYSIDGREGQLEGAEKVLWKRVKKQEDRFQESYAEQVQSRRNAGKRGAAKRWQTIAEDGTAKNGIAKDGSAIAEDGTPCQAIADDGKHSKTETKTKTEIETETEILPPGGGRDTRPPARAREALAAVMTAYLDRVNPQLSERSRDELAGFAQVMGAEVCLRAIDAALDAKKANWPYIKAILQAKQAQGVRCLADWDALEERRQKPGERRRAGTGNPFLAMLEEQE